MIDKMLQSKYDLIELDLNGKFSQHILCLWITISFNNTQSIQSVILKDNAKNCDIFEKVLHVLLNFVLYFFFIVEIYSP